MAGEVLRTVVRQADLDELVRLVTGGGVVVLSGAGLSTESGIPDYRGPTGAQRRTAPMRYARFVGAESARRRYWARSFLGWPLIARAVPHAGHLAVTALQEQGLLAGIVTQNVDGLHTAGAAVDVVELHGSLHRVRCLDCGAVSPRSELQTRLQAANEGWSGSLTDLHPDGDVELSDDAVAGFSPVDCRLCGGLLKPDVVFFGETVPPAQVAASFALVERARLLLVLGSSLAVLSGYRFVLRAAKLGVPVAIVNQGPTRGDPHAVLTMDAALGELLPRLAHAAAGRTSPRRSPTTSPVMPARTARRPGPKT